MKAGVLESRCVKTGCRGVGKGENLPWESGLGRGEMRGDLDLGDN